MQITFIKLYGLFFYANYNKNNKINNYEDN